MNNINDNRIATLIISYNPDIAILKKNIDAILNQTAFVLIVDNGSANEIDIINLISEMSKIQFIENESNLGIAKALNIGMLYLESKGYQWVITLDQDSICEKDMLLCLKQNIGDGIGIVCPKIAYWGWHNHKKLDLMVQEIEACMTSASLTSLSAWRCVGGFEEDYFIDFVDNEFCMKLRINGYKIIRNNACCLEHRLGNADELVIMKFIRIRYSKHISWRYYYIVRNHLLYIQTYKKQINVFVENARLFYNMLMGILFSDDRKGTLHYIRLGIKDAKNKRTGNRFGENRSE